MPVTTDHAHVAWQRQCLLYYLAGIYTEMYAENDLYYIGFYIETYIGTYIRICPRIYTRFYVRICLDIFARISTGIYI